MRLLGSDGIEIHNIIAIVNTKHSKYVDFNPVNYVANQKVCFVIFFKYNCLM